MFIGMDGFGLTGEATQGTFFSYKSSMGFYPGGSQSLTLKTSGNIGVGTNAPAYKLDVNGTANVTTSLTAGAIS